MGKDFNSRNDTGQTGNVPLDGPGSPHRAKAFAGPSYQYPPLDSPHTDSEQEMPERYEAFEQPEKPPLDSPNEKGQADVKGRDANPTY